MRIIKISWHQIQIMYGVGSGLDRATQAIIGALSALRCLNYLILKHWRYSLLYWR